MEGAGKASSGSRVTAVAVSGSPGSSAGSHHFHCTIPTEATDNAHSGDFVLHFLVQFSYFLPQALPLLLSASFCFLPLLFLLQLWVLTLVGLFTQTFNPDTEGELDIPSNTVSHFPSGFRQVEPCSICSIFRWFIRGFQAFFNESKILWTPCFANQPPVICQVTGCVRIVKGQVGKPETSESSQPPGCPQILGAAGTQGKGKCWTQGQAVPPKVVWGVPVVLAAKGGEEKSHH